MTSNIPFAGNHVVGTNSILRGALFIACTMGIVDLPANAQGVSPAIADARQPAPRDGSHDFDFEIGTWRTHLKRLVRPLTGSTVWVDYDGRTVVRKVWNGRANLVELDVAGPSGRIEALSLRLYNPETHQWSLNFANSAGGTMATPSVGGFGEGRGEFLNHEVIDGRMVLVRFEILVISPTSCHFEQSYSIDEGKTWEINWVADDTMDEATKKLSVNSSISFRAAFHGERVLS